MSRSGPRRGPTAPKPRTNHDGPKPRHKPDAAAGSVAVDSRGQKYVLMADGSVRRVRE